MFHENLPAESAANPLLTRVAEDFTSGPPGIVKQIAAETDVDAVAEWLRGFEDSPKTLKAYKRESERFLQWIALLRPGATLKKLMLEDIRAYESFLRAIPTDWIAERKVARASPNWKPFAGQLTTGSLRYAMTVLKSMMAWLQAAGYAATNPFMLDKKRYKQQKTANLGVTRYLSKEAVAFVFEAIDWMAAHHPFQKREKARLQFLFCLYYDSALRLFEPVGANFGAIDQDSEGFWLYVTGKGDKLARVPLSPRTLSALHQYMEAFGLVNVDENDPLLLAMRGKRRRATEATIGLAIRKIFKLASKIALEAGNESDARDLCNATPHWIRHSRISHLINAGANVNEVRQLARHENLETTSRYSHAEAQALQRLVEVV